MQTNGLDGCPPTLFLTYLFVCSVVITISAEVMYQQMFCLFWPSFKIKLLNILKNHRIVAKLSATIVGYDE